MITAKQVYEQHSIDKRNLQNQINDVADDANIALHKISELYTTMKAGNASCLSVCEINQIIKDYVNELDVYVGEIDQSTLGQLTFISTDPEIPPIIVDLCPHVQHCETDTTLSKVPASLQLQYVAEDHTDLLDFSDWFTAQKVSWSGTATGRPNDTVQGITDEIVLAVDEAVDCGYFTGGGVPAYTLALDDLSDVNVSGVPLNIGDFLMFDGNNWVPNAGSISFDCSLLSGCTLPNSSPFTSVNSNTLIRENVGTGQYNRDFIVGGEQLDYNGSNFERLMFKKSKGAFRAGHVSSTDWDDSNMGNYSTGFGFNSKASGNYSYTEGYQNESTGESAHSENSLNKATGTNSHAEGFNTIASGYGSHTEGYQSRGLLDISHNQGGGKNTQFTRVVTNIITQNSTPTNLKILNNTVNYLTIPEETAVYFEVSVVARQFAGSAGTVGDSAAYKIEGLIKRDGANNTVLVGSPTITTIAEDAGATAWSVGASADDTNEALSVSVVGETNKYINWEGTVRFNQVGSTSLFL